MSSVPRKKTNPQDEAWSATVGDEQELQPLVGKEDKKAENDPRSNSLRTAVVRRA